MAQFEIVFGVGGGYNDIRSEVIEADTITQAEEIAYRSACEVYDSYGLFDQEHPDWDYDSDSENYEGAYRESVESWCDYYVISRKVT